MWFSFCEFVREKYSDIIIIIITFQTANPNWESQMLKTQRPQLGRRPVRNEETWKEMKTTIKPKNNNKITTK